MASVMCVCMYVINVQARSLEKQFLTNARKYVPNEKKGEVKIKETKQTQTKDDYKIYKNINKMDFTN